MNPPGSRTPFIPSTLDLLRRRERRAIKAGLVISGLLHLVAILLYPVFAGSFDPSPPDEVTSELVRTPQGTEVVVILETPEPEPPPVAEPPPTIEPPPAITDPPPDPLPPTEPEAETAVDPVGPPEDDDEDLVTVPEGPGPSVAERLRPRMVDPRVWAPVDPQRTDLTDAERAQLLLHGMIRTWSDSVAVAEALSDRARDWTYTDAEGRRWGLSPGRLHLGDFSIPLPFAFQTPPGLRDDWATRQWILDDLARGAANAEIQESWVDRARAIRERMERERSGAGDASSDGGGP